MNTHNCETFSISFEGHELHAYRFCPSGTATGRIFYLHGGGLVFGEPEDLPECYVNLLLNAGYELISLDYPLAPEQKLPVILEAVHTAICHLLKVFSDADSASGASGASAPLPYYLFGRSAGAYLALMEARRLSPVPTGLLCFYGYHTFDLPEFQKPSSWFTKLPLVSKQTVDSLIQADGAWLTHGPMATRYSLYIYARQQGCWPELLGSPEEILTCSLTEEDFALLPPGFFTASSGDQDVPFRESKQMARKIPGSKFFPVYYLEHDFDRDTSKPEGLQAYQAALAWMKGLKS